jgi:Skp family chaperone for outer membrane proteins
MKTLRFGLVLVALAAPILRGGTVAAQGRFPIAYVSMQKIVTEANDAKVAAGKFETMRQEKAREITAKQKEADAAQLAVVQAGGVFQRSRRTALQADENRQRAELKKLTDQAQADLQNLQRQLQADLRERITAILAQLVKQKGVQLVLNQDTAVVFAQPGVDLTMEVLSALNAAPAPKQTRP